MKKPYIKEIIGLLYIARVVFYTKKARNFLVKKLRTKAIKLLFIILHIFIQMSTHRFLYVYVRLIFNLYDI